MQGGVSVEEKNEEEEEEEEVEVGEEEEQEAEKAEQDRQEEEEEEKAVGRAEGTVTISASVHEPPNSFHVERAEGREWTPGSRWKVW